MKKKTETIWLMGILLVICAIGTGCGDSSCPLDLNGDGTLTIEEASSFQSVTDPGQAIDVGLKCQNQLFSLANQTAQQGANP